LWAKSVSFSSIFPLAWIFETSLYGYQCGMSIPGRVSNSCILPCKNRQKLAAFYILHKNLNAGGLNGREGAQEIAKVPEAGIIMNPWGQRRLVRHSAPAAAEGATSL